MLNAMKYAFGGKKSFLFFVLCVCTSTMFSQNITNTLGSSGSFIVKDGTTTFLTLDQAAGNLTLNSIAIFQGANRFLHNFGTENTFLGINSGNFTMTGVGFNTAVGGFSLNANVTGYNNSAFGNYSLRTNSTGYQNSAFGYASLYSNISGHHNTAVGDQALYSNTTGYENTANGDVALYLNTLGIRNTANGYRALYSNAGGENNTALGWGAGASIITGRNLTCIGYDAQPSIQTALNQITLGNNQVTSLRCNVQTITSLSDWRDKKNITDLTLGLDFITKLKPREFNWDKREWYDDNKSDGSKMQETPTAGFIAQELDSAQISAKAEWLKLVLKDNPEKWEATPGNLLPIIVKSIQDLKKENDELQVANNELKTTNVELTSRLNKFEQMQNMLVSEIEKIKTNSNETTKVSLGEK